MSVRARLAVALALGLALSALCAAGWLLVLDSEPVRLVDRTDEIGRILTQREGAGSATGERIPRDVARVMFLTDDRRFEWDPHCYFRYRPGHVQVRQWEEHPDGEWTRRTNAQGLREDDDARLRDADLAVLVTGDSHTDGACNNAESFANRLEARLRAREPERRVEVLNAGVVGYTFHNHLGVLERFLGEAPDVFIVCVYGGNDFLEALRPHHYLTGTTYPPRRQAYWDRIEAAKQVSQTFVAQSLNQALFLQEHPEELEVALEGALAVSAEIARLCRERGVRLLVAYLPPAYEASWPELDALLERAMRVLDLTESDLFVTRRLEARFFAGLRELGVEPIDLGPALRARGERCYWARDLHLNLAGHELVAQVLEQHLLAGGGELAPSVPLVRPDGPAEEREAGGALLARGAWRDGRRAGEWVLFHPGGAERCRGSWSGGERVGEWTWWYENGQLQQRGAFAAGRRDGPWREWYRDGTPRHEGAYAAGLPVGSWRDWHPGGAPAGQGAWRDGREHGAWRTFHPDGSLQAAVTYADGVLHGRAERRRRDGSLEWAGRFEAGQRLGSWTFEHPGGQTASAGSYVAGRREGPWRFWSPDGTIDSARSGTYRAGERIDD